VDFRDIAKQRNGGGGREKDLYMGIIDKEVGTYDGIKVWKARAMFQIFKTKSVCTPKRSLQDEA
jgi:hypothetical protein